MLTFKWLHNGLKHIITELYRDIAMEKLPLKTEIVRVKKGKARYRLVFMEKNDLKLRFNIGRHKDGLTLPIN